MPKEPPRDANGFTTPHDHDEILDEHHVIRHILPNELSGDGAGGKRVSSGAYSESGDPSKGMSIDIEDWMHADGLPSLHYVRDPQHGAVRLKVGDLRALGLRVGWDPRKEEPAYPANPHHGLVWGLTSGKRRRVQKLAITLRKAEGET